MAQYSTASSPAPASCRRYTLGAMWVWSSRYRQICAHLLRLCLLATLASPAWPGMPCEAAPADARARAQDAGGQATFEPPAGWRRDLDAPSPNIVYVAPGEKGVVNIGEVSSVVGKRTLDDIVASNRAFATRLHGLQVYDEQRTTLAGAPAYRWRIHVRPLHGAPHETLQVFCVRNARSYVLTLAALPANIGRFEHVFNVVVSSFRWSGKQRLSNR